MALDAIGIIVKDIDKSINFYKLLGIDFKELGNGHYEGVTPSGIRLMLDSEELMKEINPNWITPTGSGRVVLCFLQDSPAKVDQVVTILSEANYTVVKEPWDAFWGQRYANVLDPSGNQIDIFAQL